MWSGLRPLGSPHHSYHVHSFMCTASCAQLHVHSFASYEHGPRCARSASFAALAVLRSAQRVAAPRRGFATVSFAPPYSPAQPRLSAAPLHHRELSHLVWLFCLRKRCEEKFAQKICPYRDLGRLYIPRGGESIFRLADPRIGDGYTTLSLTPTGVPNES